MNKQDLVLLESLYQKVIIKENQFINNMSSIKSHIEEIVSILAPELKDDVDYEQAIEDLSEKIKDIVHNTATEYLSEYENYEESTIQEGKKKVNPWAVAKSIAKKKHLGSKKEEEIVKGVKKSAKKYGKKVTSDKIVKENRYAMENPEDWDRFVPKHTEYESSDEDSDGHHVHKMSIQELLEFLNASPEEIKSELETFENLSEEDKEDYIENLRDAVYEYNSKLYNPYDK